MRIYKYALAPILLIIIIVAAISFTQNNFSAFLPGSKLWFWETRIDGVAEEFLRRSPRLRAAQRDYLAQCYNKPDCNKAHYFNTRDKIVREEWKSVFDRLIVEDDWGRGRWSAKNHAEFQYYLREDTGFGANNLRNNYLPVLHYRDGLLRLDTIDEENNKVHFVASDHNPG